jgi:hypothetical protein
MTMGDGQDTLFMVTPAMISIRTDHRHAANSEFKLRQLRIFKLNLDVNVPNSKFSFPAEQTTLICHLLEVSHHEMRVQQLVKMASDEQPIYGSIGVLFYHPGYETI